MSKPSFFKKLFGSPTTTPAAPPEIMELRLGGIFEVDEVLLKLFQNEWVTENVAKTQYIQAVGSVRLDGDSQLLRFYTDDDAFLQVLFHGAAAEENVEDVKLWHFYKTETVGSEQDWQKVLRERVSRPQIEFEGHTYTRVWSSAGAEAPPVAMTETTYLQSGTVERTDQFTMLYQREVSAGRLEYLLLAAEEKWQDDRPDRYLVTSTGIDLARSDFVVVG